MKHIFSSVGANYQLEFSVLAFRQLFTVPTVNERSVALKCEELFSKKAHFYYKGRDAIECALKGLGVGNTDSVFIQAFACFAIEEAINRVGARVRYVDIDATYNMSVKSLEFARKKYGKPKAVLVQHTLGIPADGQGIKRWCKSNQVLLIEDLAQAFGAVDEKQNWLGTKADAVIVSCGRDKIIDTVSGGVCLIPGNVQMPQISKVVGRRRIISDLTYPLITTTIRKTYRYGVGKIIHQIGKQLGYLQSPLISPTSEASSLPEEYLLLIKHRLDTLQEQLLHRRAISLVYLQHLSKYSSLNADLIERGANLRFPLQVTNLLEVITHLRSKGIHIADRWYRSAVDCSTLVCHTSYEPGSCPVAERASQRVINLPTHHEVSEEDALLISRLILEIAKP